MCGDCSDGLMLCVAVEAWAGVLSDASCAGSGSVDAADAADAEQVACEQLCLCVGVVPMDSVEGVVNLVCVCVAGCLGWYHKHWWCGKGILQWLVC